MICSKCKHHMVTGKVNGVPSHICFNCGRTIRAILAGATESTIPGPTPTDALPKPQKSPPRQHGGSNEGPSVGESLFAEQWGALYPDLPCVPEHMFNYFRNWKLDFAWPCAKVAVEVESSVHRIKSRFATDIPKYNALSHDGWILYRCTKAMLDSDAERFCRMVAETLTKRGAGTPALPTEKVQEPGWMF